MGRNDDSDEDEDNIVKEPVSSFQSLFAEGDILAKQGDFKKAVIAYTKALGMKLGDKNCLVARSKCYLQLGDSENALEDANMALKGDALFFKGVFQKAEALYARGDFEMALVFYHRGSRLRPELDEFRLGIQKAREAIDNSIGNPKDYKFQAPPGTKISADGKIILAAASHHPGGTKPAITLQSSNKQKDVSIVSGKSAKQLLGEIYQDREYLENFLLDKDFEHNPNQGVMNLVSGCLRYLDTRTDFWRQQKPIYARRKEHSRVIVRAISARNRALIEEKGKEHREREARAVQDLNNPKAGGGVKSKLSDAESQRNRFTAETEKYVTASMNVVSRSIEKKDYQRALQAAKSLLTRLTDIHNLPNREKAISDVTSMIGNIYMDVGQLPQAMQFYRKDLSQCKTKHLPECLTRALGNMGRISVKLRRFDDAILFFEQKLALAVNVVVTDLSGETTIPTPPSSAGSARSTSSNTPPTPERAWLLHDIGRCHLEMGRDDKAKHMGISSLKASEALKDRRWCLNALVLIGQVEVRNEKFEAAVKVYTKALAYSKELEDARATEAITEALSQLKGKLPPPPPPTSPVKQQQQQSRHSSAGRTQPQPPPPQQQAQQFVTQSSPHPPPQPPTNRARPQSAAPNKVGGGASPIVEKGKPIVASNPTKTAWDK
ncbi:UNVERIFIED_CONTAM: Tetratricopeptide repeat protein 25 [Siphonaria sp. JEL0065]|nr:Tetratricopeptide repeat protein 25 [Siphonaria sp. JEL0065]